MDSKYIFYWIITVIGIMFLSSCAGQVNQVQDVSKLQDASTSLSSSDLAKCLAANGAKVYGASSCSHCQDQKAFFGEDWKFINFIECEVPEDSNAQRDECLQAGITAYPTWVFKDGQVKQGIASIDELVQMSGCKSPVAAPSVPIAAEELPDAQTDTETIIGQTPSAPEPQDDISVKSVSDTPVKSVSDTSGSKEESITYQIDLDVTFKHVGRDKSYTNKAVLSTEKTITRAGPGWKFTGKSGEMVPIKVSTEGYQDSGCMKGGKDYDVRGTYSGNYEGKVEVVMVYFDENYSDNPPELLISFSEIEDLPKASFKSFVCVPTPEDVGNNALNTELLNFGGFTSMIGFRLGFLTTLKTEDGATFKSADGGTIDVSGPDSDIINGKVRVLEGYTWSGFLSVKRIS